MSKKLSRVARSLRKNSTEAEKLLWRNLRGKQLEGFKFRRQQPMGMYVVDFVNFERRIVIEVDGGQHAVEWEKDRKRDKWVREQGYEILRFWDNEVFDNLEGVLEVVRRRLLSPPLDPLPPGAGSD